MIRRQRANGNPAADPRAATRPTTPPPSSPMCRAGGDHPYVAPNITRRREYESRLADAGHPGLPGAPALSQETRVFGWGR